MVQFHQFVATVTLLAFLVPSQATAYNYGIGAYVSSENNKGTLVDALADMGASVDRENFTYSTNPDFTGADEAVARLRAKNIQILAVIGATDPAPSVADWNTFLSSVVTRYKGKIAAYEIFNEQDTKMSGSAYAPYLKQSYSTIKAIDSSAKVVVGGLTGRTEAVPFWNALYEAGGKDSFDALGIHPYRDVAPEIVKYNIGDFTNTLELAANVIRSHGGGKTIWITEFGYTMNQTGGETNFENWMVRSYLMSRLVPEVDQVLMYRLRNGDDDSSNNGGGVLKRDLSRRSLYDRYKELVAPLTNAGQPRRVYATTRTVIDSFDSTDNWNTDSTNTSLSVGGADGQHYGGMKLEYRFNGSDAFAQASRPITIAGEPTAIGVWAKGPETTSVFKLRFVDANDETFQLDMGKLTNDWRFFNFVFGQDKAITSWGGDGTINYPIKFDSFIYERSGGQASGTVVVDQLQVTTGPGDLHALLYSGNRLAYWKQSGTATAKVCGADREFAERPKLDTNVDAGACVTNPNDAVTTASASSSSTRSSSSSSSESSSDPTEAITAIGDASSIDEANARFDDAVSAINAAFDAETASARETRDAAIASAGSDEAAAIDAATAAYDEATAGAATARDEAINAATVSHDEAINAANAAKDEAINAAGDDAKAVKAAERAHATAIRVADAAQVKAVRAATTTFTRVTKGALAAKKRAIAAASAKKKVAAANAAFKRATAGATRLKNARLNAAKKARTAKVRALTPKRTSKKR